MHNLAKFAYIGGASLIAVVAYDQVAIYVNTATGKGTLPFVWDPNTIGQIANEIPEVWVALLGGILILIGVLMT